LQPPYFAAQLSVLMKGLNASSCHGNADGGSAQHVASLHFNSGSKRQSFATLARHRIGDL
jgi:hypothetical protein